MIPDDKHTESVKIDLSHTLGSVFNTFRSNGKRVKLTYAVADMHFNGIVIIDRNGQL